MQYLVTMTTHVPDGTPEQAVDEVKAREAAHSAELAAQGNLLRLWRPPLRPGEWRTLGLFVAADADQLEKVLAAMPLRIWRSDEVTPLAPHPNDPAMRARTGVNDRALSAGTGDPEFLTFFSVVYPGRHDRPGGGRRRGAGGRAGGGVGGQGQAAAAVGAARPGAGARPVAGRRPGRDAGDHQVAAA